MGEQHDTKMRDILIEGIKSAKSSINLAAAYFNDLEIAGLIKKRADEGVFVEVVVCDHPINSSAIMAFESLKVRTYFYPSNNTQPICPKFCIIDENILFTGKNGWGYAANKSAHPEPRILNNEKWLVEEYVNKFNAFKNNCSSSRFVHFKIIPAFR